MNIVSMCAVHDRPNERRDDCGRRLRAGAAGIVGKGRIDKLLGCPHTGDVVDRDHNAARNLRDWPEPASCGPVRTTAPSVPGP
ncbi:MAG: putative transposase, partial [Mycobacterium sp.]|nr:putative transposase [Mycobacterium sp.]